MTSTRVLTCLQAGQESSALAAVPSPSSPSQAGQTYQLHSVPAMAQDIGQAGPRKGCDMVIHGWPTGLGGDPWEAAVTTADTYRGSTTDVAQTFGQVLKKLLATKTLQPPVPAETCLGPAHSTPQLCAISGKPTVGEGMWFSAWTGNILELCECKSLPFLCTSPLGKTLQVRKKKGLLKVRSACLSQASGLSL